MILGLGRTAKREPLFEWIAPLKKPTKIYAYQLRTNTLNINNTDDLKAYSVAVERGSYTHDYLLEIDFDVEKIITVAKASQLLPMISHQRADLFLLDAEVLKVEANKRNIDVGLFEPSFLAFTVTEYLAVSKQTPRKVITQLKASYKALFQQGKINLPD